MDEEKGTRRKIGAHYTSEKNILKCIGPALIHPLRTEFAKATTERALAALLAKVAKTKILDPACGCGNFLVVAYRELRQIEIDVLERLQSLSGTDAQQLSIAKFATGIDVDAMCGIEIDELPCRVALAALCIMHQMMNNKATEKLGEAFRPRPLSKAPHIVNANALRIDWASVVRPDQLSAIVGNPPFIGKKARSKNQAQDMDLVFGDWKGHGELDYASAWFVKALEFIKATAVPVAFVSTNSLTQGEQVGIFLAPYAAGWPAHPFRPSHVPLGQ